METTRREVLRVALEPLLVVVVGYLNVIIRSSDHYLAGIQQFISCHKNQGGFVYCGSSAPDLPCCRIGTEFETTADVSERLKLFRPHEYQLTFFDAAADEDPSDDEGKSSRKAAPRNAHTHS